MKEKIFMPKTAVCKLIQQMQSQIETHMQRRHEDYYLIGIHSGGAWLAQIIHRNMNLATPLGELDINFYRDDFTRIGLHPQVKPSSIPFQVENKHLILIDDVLHTGRTIRAAMNEIFDFGRPASISLAVLIERSGKELPIQSDIAGLKLDLKEQEYIKLSEQLDLYISSQQHDECA